MGKKYERKSDSASSLVAAVKLAVPGISHAYACKLLKSGEVRLNGARKKLNVEVSAGDTVTVFVPDTLEISPLKANIVYEDDKIVVFDKPKHMSFDAVPTSYGKPLYAVHRLDTNTEGLIVFAKTKIAEKELLKAFKDGKAHKKYLAIVSPPPEKKSDVLTAYMKESGGVVSVKSAPAPDYKTAVTEYDVIKEKDERALLSITLHTGRTHQIRAHMAFIGCPIVGDPKYGRKGDKKISGGQMLAAVELSFDGLEGELSYLNEKTFETDVSFRNMFE